MKIFKDQSILEIVLETGVSVDGADVAKILVVKPGNEKTQWNAVKDGTKLNYTVQEGDLNKVGAYQVQAYFESGGLKIFGQIATFEVHKNIE